FGVARARQDVFFDGRPYQTPKLIRNEFGGSIGGPIVLPSFGLDGKKLYNGRNRSFFFFTREGSELVQGLTREFRVPTAAMRAGDFSGLIDSAGRRLDLYDPLTTRIEELPNGRLVTVRDRFINNQIPIERLNPLTKRIYDITPLPTDTTFLPVRGRAVALSWIHTFSSSLNVETLVNRTWQFSRTVTGPVDKDWSKELGLPNPLAEIGWPNITGTGFMSYVEGDNRRQLYSMISNVQQNYSFISGRHHFGWGFSHHDEKQHLLPDQGAISGSVSYSSLATALESSTTGSTLAPAATPQ